MHIRQDGEFWLLEFQHRACVLPDSAGLRQLCYLVAARGESVSSLDLASMACSATPGDDMAPRRCDVEQARINVTRTLRAALRRIAAAHPELHQHLLRTLTTGSRCRYDPAADGIELSPP